MKVCSTCSTPKELEEFNRQTKSKDGRQGRCRLCASTQGKVWRAENAEQVKAYQKVYNKSYKHKLAAARWRSLPENARRVRELNKQFAKRSPEKMLWYDAGKRARRKGIPFTISCADIIIPGHCPVLGIPLRRSEKHPTDFSPTIDEIIRGRGYTPDNIAVISYRANRLKNDGTLDELKAIVAWLESKHVPPAVVAYGTPVLKSIPAEASVI